MHETFLTYGMTSIVHLGVSLSFFLSSFFLVLAASILSGSLYIVSVTECLQNLYQSVGI